MNKFERLGEDERAGKLRLGYTEGPQGLLVPPGWKIVPDG